MRLPPPLHAAIEQITAFAHDVAPQCRVPLVIALDGPSGAGKSALARPLAVRLQASVIATDDFFAATIAGAQWDAWSPEERAAHVIDWSRVRTEVLRPLMEGRYARWHPFDFAGGPRADGTYAMAHAWCE